MQYTETQLHAREKYLEEVIKSAIQKGFGFYLLKKQTDPIVNVELDNNHVEIQLKGWSVDYNIYELLFDHAFAQAYFGERWTYHLQQAVLMNDLVEYYYRFI